MKIRYIRKKMSEIKLSESAKSVILMACIGLAIGLVLKLFAIDILHVSGVSMEPAIHDRSTLIVNRLAFGLAAPFSGHLALQWSKPAVGDVVIYLYDNKIVVKRCVAVEGQLLEYSENPVYNLKVGDKNIPLSKLQYTRLKDTDKVPEGYILAIGDNYAQSVDSRDYGFVSMRDVLGKVLCK